MILSLIHIFHRDERWLYDEDASFPVDSETMAMLLEPFQSFGASFVIEDAENLSQYGLNSPECTIRIDTEEESYTITLGDYSTMDAQRYVSIGDGNVYLVSDDPMENFDLSLRLSLIHISLPQPAVSGSTGTTSSRSPRRPRD